MRLRGWRQGGRAGRLAVPRVWLMMFGCLCSDVLRRRVSTSSSKDASSYSCTFSPPSPSSVQLSPSNPKMEYRSGSIRAHRWWICKRPCTGEMSYTSRSSRRRIVVSCLLQIGKSLKKLPKRCRLALNGDIALIYRMKA